MTTIVTGNPNKLNEFQVILSGMDLTSRAVDIPEIQSMNLEEVARAKVKAAFDVVGSPVIVEDVSFEIAALSGMPGPFVKWWAQSAGYEPALVVCEKMGNWSAIARCAAAYCDGARTIYVEHVEPGRLTQRAEGEGFGFDFYFIPEGYDKTYSQLGLEVKNQISHRARAIRKLFEALKQAGI